MKVMISSEAYQGLQQAVPSMLDKGKRCGKNVLIDLPPALIMRLRQHDHNINTAIELLVKFWNKEHEDVNT